VASVPLTAVILVTVVREQTLLGLTADPSALIIWCGSLVTSLAAVTILASIGELQHRHTWMSFIYRYVPMVMCLGGLLAWLLLLFVDNPLAHVAHKVITTLPVIGLSPILLAPIASLDSNLVLIHM